MVTCPKMIKEFVAKLDLPHILQTVLVILRLQFNIKPTNYNHIPLISPNTRAHEKLHQSPRMEHYRRRL